MKISSYIRRELVFSDVAPGERADVLRAIVGHVVEAGAIAEKSAATVIKRVLDREARGTTGIGNGVAIPHCKTGVVDAPLVAFARPAEPIPYAATDGEPVHSLFLVVSPLGADAEHVEILRWVAKLARDDYYTRILSTTRDPRSLYDLFLEVDGDS